MIDEKVNEVAHMILNDVDFQQIPAVDAPDDVKNDKSKRVETCSHMRQLTLKATNRQSMGQCPIMPLKSASQRLSVCWP